MEPQAQVSWVCHQAGQWAVQPPTDLCILVIHKVLFEPPATDRLLDYLFTGSFLRIEVVIFFFNLY